MWVGMGVVLRVWGRGANLSDDNDKGEVRPRASGRH